MCTLPIDPSLLNAAGFTHGVRLAVPLTQDQGARGGNFAQNEPQFLSPQKYQLMMKPQHVMPPVKGTEAVERPWRGNEGDARQLDWGGEARPFP